MKKATHPVYVDTTISCACGTVHELGNTVANMKVEICSACHPFFTGTQKLMDREGRVERFKNKYANVSTAAKK